MGTHSLVVLAEQADLVEFECSACGARLNFMKEETGLEPFCSGATGAWVPVANPDDYLGACPSAERGNES